MTARQLTLYHQTRLAVRIVIEDDTGVLAFSILVTTQLFALPWKLGRWLSAADRELALLASDFRAALDFTAKVLAIAFISLAYGLGVTQ